MEAANALMPKFFVISSVILIIAGVAQVLVRPRKQRESLPERLINRATITAIITVGFGVFFLLMGLGLLPMIRLRLG